MRNPQLDGETYFIEGSQNGILLFHGFTATTAEVRLLADCLVEHGYTILAPLLPGHGTHPKELNQTRRSDWIRAAEKAYQFLSSRCSSVWVGGESMGALVALYLASLHPEIAGILAYAPALRVKSITLSRFFAPFISFKKKQPSQDQLPWKGYNVYPVKAASEFYRFQNDVYRRLPQVRQPIMIIQGRKDQTIDPHSGEMIIENVHSQSTELHWLEKSPHCLLLDSELDIALGHTLRFIKGTSPHID